MRLVLGLENVEDDADSVFVVVSNDSLVSVGRIRFYDATLLLTCFRGFVVFELDGFGIEWSGIFPKKKSLHLDELNVGVFWSLTRHRGRYLHPRARLVSFPGVVGGQIFRSWKLHRPGVNIVLDLLGSGSPEVLILFGRAPMRKHIGLTLVEGVGGTT